MQDQAAAAQLPAAQLPAAHEAAAQLPVAPLPAAQLPAAQLPAAQLPAVQDQAAAQLAAAQLAAAQEAAELWEPAPREAELRGPEVLWGPDARPTAHRDSGTRRLTALQQLPLPPLSPLPLAAPQQRDYPRWLPPVSPLPLVAPWLLVTPQRRR